MAREVDGENLGVICGTEMVKRISWWPLVFLFFFFVLRFLIILVWHWELVCDFLCTWRDRGGGLASFWRKGCCAVLNNHWVALKKIGIVGLWLFAKKSILLQVLMI